MASRNSEIQKQDSTYLSVSEQLSKIQNDSSHALSLDTIHLLIDQTKKLCAKVDDNKRNLEEHQKSKIF